MSPSPVPTRRRARARAAALAAQRARPPAAAIWYRRPEVQGLAVVATVALMAVVGPSAAGLVGLGTGAAVVLWRAHVRADERRRRRAQLPQVLERIAVALRAGSSLPQALAAAGSATPEPLGRELVGLARDAERGLPIVEILDGWVANHDDRGTRLAATAFSLAAGVGAAPARAIDGVATTLREHQELGAERRALATQARTSALVLSVAPVGFALLFGISDSAAARFLLGTSTGWGCLVLGVGLDLVGAVWMARLVRTHEALYQ